MDWLKLQDILVFVQHSISFVGVFIIVTGVLYSLYRYICSFIAGQVTGDGANINSIRLDLGRVLILGLEFIVAADLIGTTTTPDYYAVGLLAIIVVIRTVLSFSINRELMSIGKEP